MSSLVDLQLQTIAKINIFHIQPRFYRRLYHGVIIHTSEVSEVRCVKCDLLICCVMAPVSVDPQKYLHRISPLISCLIFSHWLVKFKCKRKFVKVYFYVQYSKLEAQIFAITNSFIISKLRATDLKERLSLLVRTKHVETKETIQFNEMQMSGPLFYNLALILPSE